MKEKRVFCGAFLTLIKVILMRTVVVEGGGISQKAKQNYVPESSWWFHSEIKYLYLVF